MISSSVWLVGCGQMSIAYTSILQDLGIDFTVIGRNNESAQLFEQKTGLNVFRGGISLALKKLPKPKHAIVAVGVDQLSDVAKQLIDYGCSSLLLEKPGALNIAHLISLCQISKEKNANIYIGYNRRFYSSVRLLRQLLTLDGGITSAQFEFTEWSHVIKNLSIRSVVKDNWLIANSTHVIDLVFSLIGKPADNNWQCWQSGSLEWHSSARFHGAGLSERDIPFVYSADWDAPGRWGIELMTKYHRFILRPLEKLQSITLGTVEPCIIELPDDYDEKFKPGLYLQCAAFLGFDFASSEHNCLCALDYHCQNFPIYNRIAGYSN